MPTLVEQFCHCHPRHANSNADSRSMSSRRVKDDYTANFAGRRSLRKTLVKFSLLLNIPMTSWLRAHKAGTKRYNLYRCNAI